MKEIIYEHSRLTFLCKSEKKVRSCLVDADWKRLGGIPMTKLRRYGTVT